VRNQITEFLNSSIGNSSIPKSLKAISPEMAIRLSIAFDTTPESWLNQQVQYGRPSTEDGGRKPALPPQASAR